MLRKSVTVLMVIFLFLAMVGMIYAAEGTVVRYQKAVVTVKIDSKDEVIFLLKDRVKVFDASGAEIKANMHHVVFKEGAKVDVKKEGKKVVEIKLK